MKAPFKHDVPFEEPPIGTVADFRHGFSTGQAYSTGILIRLQSGHWSTTTRPHASHQVQTWDELTDLKMINAAMLDRTPDARAKVVVVAVELVAAGGEALREMQHSAWTRGYLRADNGGPYVSPFEPKPDELCSICGHPKGEHDGMAISTEVMQAHAAEALGGEGFETIPAPTHGDPDATVPGGPKFVP